MNEENYTLVRGSIYSVKSAGSNESVVVTEGEFLGYLPFGDESAVALRITSGDAKGTVRIIPCNSIYYVDVVKQEREKEKVKQKEEEVKFYG
jgi:hypothetical protein